MKTEAEIRTRINALKMDVENPLKLHRPFELGRLNYTIQALEWVLRTNPEHCSLPIGQCLDNHNCVTCAHKTENIDNITCRTCMTSFCQYSKEAIK